MVSVIERSPTHLIKEIILVDDGNEDVTVGKELDKIDKVHLLRNEKRIGLIRSRVLAVESATGQYSAYMYTIQHVQILLHRPPKY